MVEHESLCLTATKINKFLRKLLIARHALTFVPDCCITEKMWDKAVNTYHSTMQFIPDCNRTQERCDEAANVCFLAFIYIAD